MMSALTRKLDEIRRLQETYSIYKDHEDATMRRKAHLDVDRFLMENRETALICMEQVLDNELKDLKAKLATDTHKRPWYVRASETLLRRRYAKGGVDNDGALPQQNATTRDA